MNAVPNVLLVTGHRVYIRFCSLCYSLLVLIQYFESVDIGT